MKIKDPLYRFEFAFDGQYQNVGILQGLDELGLPEETAGQLMSQFNRLPLRPLAFPCSFWFTEAGIRGFAKPVERIRKAAAELNWQLLVAVKPRRDMPCPEYEDKFQVAFRLDEDFSPPEDWYVPVTSVTGLLCHEFK